MVRLYEAEPGATRRRGHDGDPPSHGFEDLKARAASSTKGHGKDASSSHDGCQIIHISEDLRPEAGTPCLLDECRGRIGPDDPEPGAG